jgi:hypothetical protein
MDVILEGANPNPKISTEGKSNDYIQYYNHNALDVRSYQKVTYYEVYPHIDWVVYINKNSGINEPKVKYDFVVHPGGDPSQIKLKTEWVEELTSNEDGSLTMKNRMGSVTEQRPVSFQEGKDVKTNFVVNNNTISFQLEKFNINTDIVIDPGLLWGTYYGGNSSDFGHSCSVDGSGNVYLAGETGSINSIAIGGHKVTIDSNSSFNYAFLVKFNSAGIRQWATYYGFISHSYNISCAVDGSENVYLAGSTYGNHTFLPPNNIAFSGHQNIKGDFNFDDAFLVKFNSTGVRQWATYYGGEYNDYGTFCTTDNNGNVYLAGITTSPNAIAFAGHQNLYAGDGDAFLVKFNSAGVRQWATYYGGINNDFLLPTCATDNNGNVYLAGVTTSPNAIAFGGHQNLYAGNGDAFLVKFNSAGVRQWATYYGGKNNDESQSCSVDDSGNVYLSGITYSKDSIASKGYQNIIGDDFNNYGDAFLVKFNSAGVRQWATYYGGENNDCSKSCVTDNNGNIYLAGYTNSYSTNAIAYGGHQKKFGGVTDAFLVKLLTCNSTSSSFNTSACGNYYWVAKKKNYTSSNNTDTVKLINSVGCDSIVTLNLTIYPNPIPTIVKTGNVLSTQSYSTYQWLNNGTNINGAVAQTYPASSNGNYQVEVTDAKNCKGISISLNVIVSSLNEIDKDCFNIYPNPSEKMLHIETNASGNWQAIITDVKGSQINQIHFNKSTQLDISNYAPGVYYIQLTGKENVLNYKFMKK